MIKCVILDDEQYAIDVLRLYVEKLPQLSLVGSSTNPMEGIEMIVKNQADLVLLDIQMDEMNGIDVMNIISPKAKVIFCTAYSEFAIKSYELDAVDYLLKPVTFDRFVKAIHRATNLILKEMSVTETYIPNDYVFVKTEQKGKMLKINLDDIDYIEGMKNYVAFHQGKDKILTYLTMKEIEERLPKNHFMRIHKSYIIALNQIKTVEGNTIIMNRRTERIPISETYREIFMEKMKNRIIRP
jgi:two-component system, LytTR family, response regulator